MNPLQLAIEHFNSRRFSDAEEIVRAVLENDRTNVVAYHLLGMIAFRTDRAQDAAMHLSKAIEIEPEYVNAYNDLANVYKANGQIDQVIATYERLLSIRPNDALAFYHLGNAFAAKGMFNKAKESFLRSVKINPGFAHAVCDLATALSETGDKPASVGWYRKAIALNPRLDVAYAGLAKSLAFLNNSVEAMRILCAALRQIPDSFMLRLSLSELLDGHPFPEVGPNERRILLDLLEDPNIPSQSLAVAVATAIEGMAAFENIRRAILIDRDIHAALEQTAFFEDALLIASLPRLVVPVEMEQILTAIRRECLLSEKPVLPITFVFALAQHCFVTEYVWQVEEKEEEKLSALIAAVTSILREASLNQVSLETHLTKIALYKPLYELLSGSTAMEVLARMNWSLPFHNIIQTQIVDVIHERKLADEIPSISDISYGASIAVQQQYENNPYPRWMDCKYQTPESFARLAAKWRPGEGAPEMPDPLPVLDAGCGTGHSPIQAARRYYRCKVTAVDISKASLGYAARMAEKYGVRNIEFRCGDILKLGTVQERFSIIICGGVLHHLDKPIEGWRVLAGLLAKGGLMKIALYSKYARKGVAAARDLFVDMDPEDVTVGDIQRCRQAIMNLPETHPARSVLYSSDFQSASGFRDLVLHNREHTFALPDIDDMLQELGLRFLGFETVPEVMAAFKRRYPQRGSETDLALWDKFEQGHQDIFWGMYQFWCSR